MKIAIAGYGAEGESSYRYFASNPEHQITIVDQHQPERQLPDDVTLITGEDAFLNLSGFDLVIRTAGLAPFAIKTDGKIWSATNEFFEKCPVPIIGVTGSKGKGTTASLIAGILEAAGKTVWLVGNIGVPALDVLSRIKAGDLVVYELSSFQLWDIERSPQTAVVLFIEQEHLNVHLDMDDYLRAKANITYYQTDDDMVVYNQKNAFSRAIAEHSDAQKIAYPSDEGAHVFDGDFYYGEQLICSVDVLTLVGLHNQENTCAAIDAVWPMTQDIEAVRTGIAGFTGLPHRLQFIREVNGVRYFDDSIATTPGSAIAALRSFAESKVIILGGSAKGSDFSELATELNRHDVQVILIGEEASVIARACDEAGFENYEILPLPDATKIVRRAAELAKPGSVVLMSPASASFGLFKNYADRGEQFTRAVGKL
jgi:UDP-N-acetylmuramoylalanine--D-glutamate ligase